MRRLLPAALALLALGCGAGVRRVDLGRDYGHQSLPRCVAVVPFENLSLTSLAGMAVSELIAAELERTGRYVVLEPGAYRWVLARRGDEAEPPEPTAPAALRYFREELGIEAIVVGTVTEYWYTDDPEVYRDKQPSVAFSVRMVDTASGAELWRALLSRTPSSLAPRMEMLAEVAAELSAELVERLEAGLPPATPPPSLCRFEELVVAGGVGHEVTQTQPPALSNVAAELKDRLARGEPFVLRGVGFTYRTTELKPGATDVLDALAELLRAYPDLVVAVIVHSDNRGDPEELRNLTLRQAERVRDYLVQQGVETRRILLEGRGGDEPLLPNINRRNRMINRRVELRLVSPPSGGW